jgi:hypothetical protein
MDILKLCFRQLVHMGARWKLRICSGENGMVREGRKDEKNEVTKKKHSTEWANQHHTGWYWR